MIGDEKKAKKRREKRRKKRENISQTIDKLGRLLIFRIFVYFIPSQAYFFKVHSIEMSYNPALFLHGSNLDENYYIQALVDEK